MCDGFSLKAGFQEVAEYFRIDQVINGVPERELFKPTEDIPLITGKNGNRSLDLYAWGIFPFWAKDSINARSESIRDHHAYKQIFAKQRGIVPCDAFYFRVPLAKKKEKLVRVELTNRSFCGLAALYDIWVSPSGSEYRMCTILTTPPSGGSSPNRLPLVLDEEGMELWLEVQNKNDARIPGLLRPMREEMFQIRA
ncbi:MAG: response-associated peptidase [Paenibacillaceae bacterium]|nr:response-associated peptidase [Paenibacillaceae bacterium]